MEGGPPHGRPAFYFAGWLRGASHTHSALETNCGRESSVLGPVLSKMGYALNALQCGLETCITSPLRRRR
jgi:hypothetical protein